jgi:hypothetical protein
MYLKKLSEPRNLASVDLEVIEEKTKTKINNVIDFRVPQKL